MVPSWVGKLFYDNEGYRTPVYVGTVHKAPETVFDTLILKCKKVSWEKNDVGKGYEGLKETGRPIKLIFPFGGISLSVNKDRGFLVLKIVPYFIQGSIDSIDLNDYIEKLELSAKAFNKSYSKYLEY